MTKTSPARLAQLRQEMVDRLSLEELRTLCTDLGVDYDDLPGEGKTAKARELAAYLDRRNRIHELEDRVAAVHPAGAPAPKRPADSPASGNHDASQHALDMARRALGILEEQAAAYTALTIPAHLKIELEEKRREVAELETRLQKP